MGRESLEGIAGCGVQSNRGCKSKTIPFHRLKVMSDVEICHGRLLSFILGEHVGGVPAFPTGSVWSSSGLRLDWTAFCGPVCTSDHDRLDCLTWTTVDRRSPRHDSRANNALQTTARFSEGGGAQKRPVLYSTVKNSSYSHAPQRRRCAKMLSERERQGAPLATEIASCEWCRSCIV
jgi:hypothetical protein